MTNAERHDTLPQFRMQVRISARTASLAKPAAFGQSSSRHPRVIQPVPLIMKLFLSSGCCAHVALMAALASAQPADPVAARAHLQQGYDLKQKGKCEEAVPH